MTKGAWHWARAEGEGTACKQQEGPDQEVPGAGQGGGWRQKKWEPCRVLEHSSKSGGFSGKVALAAEGGRCWSGRGWGEEDREVVSMQRGQSRWGTGQGTVEGGQGRQQGL